MDWTITTRPALGRTAARIIVVVALVLMSGCANMLTVKNSADGEDQPQPKPAVTQPAHYDNLWDRIRAGFALAPIDSPNVQYYEQWYSSRPEYVAAMVSRARRYLYYIVEQVDKRHMPMEIALLPVIESAYRPQAYSRARAVGLWQFISSTGRLYGLRQNWWYDGRRDVVASTQAALDYLEKLHNDFNGNWNLALAAYNAGENKVQNSIRHNERYGHPTDYLNLRLKRETRRYVPKLMAVVNIVRDPKKYGLTLAPIPNQPYFASVDPKGQIDLGVAARLAGVSTEELHELNPGYSRWATDPNGPDRLLVPVDKAAQLRTALVGLPSSKRMRWAHYVVHRGDNLGHIARHYGINVAAIRSTNRLHGSFIRAGQGLLIPLSTRSFAGQREYTARRRPTVARTQVAARSSVKPQAIHRVRKGDTLWAIAQQYNVYVHQLARWNGLSTHDVLRLGQKILIMPH